MAAVNKKILSAIFVLLIMLLVSYRPHAAADTSKVNRNTSGITISPFVQQIVVEPGDVAKSFSLKLTNNTESLQELRLSARDFGSLNETGGVLLEGNSDYVKKYGLASWLTLGTDTVVLQPKESRDVQVTVTNRTALQPGGHYAAVIASVKGLDTISGNEVAVNQQLMSLIMAKKTGGEQYALKLHSIEHDGNWLRLPDTVKLRFQNPGNVHVVPRGTVVLKSPSGTVLARGIINTESVYVLPETIREVYVPLTKVNNDLPFPGLYHIEVEYRYDGIEKVAHKSLIVRFINLKLWALLLVLAVAAWWFVKRQKRARQKTNN